MTHIINEQSRVAPKAQGNISSRELLHFFMTELDFSYSAALIVEMLYYKKYVCSRQELIATIDPYDRYDHDKIVIDSHIKRIRKKLDPYGIRIETQYGLGYRLSEESRVIIDREVTDFLFNQEIIPKIILPQNFLRLTPTRIKILQFLIDSPFARSRDEILDLLCQNGREVFGRTIDQHIKYMRNDVLLFDIKILAFHGLGYGVPASSQIRVRELVPLWSSTARETHLPCKSAHRSEADLLAQPAKDRAVLHY